MSYKDVMDVILPPKHGKSPHITGHYGEQRAKGPHGGSDFNYVGGQSGINLNHPAVHSPVSGKVLFVGGEYGTVMVRDAEGNEHKILHMDTQTVRLHQEILAGDQIGTMGGRGPKGPNQYPRHVHYQMKDANGHKLNPEEFWKKSDLSKGNENPAKANVVREFVAAESSTAVCHLQEQLTKLGYKDAQARQLVTDGNLGPKTKQALQAFQRDHDLEPDGIAGPRTQAALRVAGQQLLTHPKHPHHDLFRSAMEKVHGAEFQRQIAPGPHSERLAAALTAEALREGLTRIDRVEFNERGTLARAVQLHPLRDESGLNRSTDGIGTQQASMQSILQSSLQARHVVQDLQVPQAELQRAPVRSAALP